MITSPVTGIDGEAERAVDPGAPEVRRANEPGEIRGEPRDERVLAARIGGLRAPAGPEREVGDVVSPTIRCRRGVSTASAAMLSLRVPP